MDAPTAPVDPPSEPTVALTGNDAGDPVARPAPAHSRALVNAARLVLAMLAIAAVALLALGTASLLFLADQPEVDGWLRAIFGRVFGIVAVGLAATLGIPSAIGLFAMAGSNREEAVPALPTVVRTVIAVIAIGVTATTAVVLIATGSSIRILNVALLALVGMSTLGLAGAVAFSPHRIRGWISAAAVVLVALGALWILNAAFIGRGV
jgi:hypothetical protein